MSNRIKKNLSLLFIFVFVSSMILTINSASTVAAEGTTFSVTVNRWDTTDTSTLPAMTVTVPDIDSLGTVSGFGGYYQRIGVFATGTYVGVPLSSFCSLVGINENYKVIVKGAMGDIEFSYNYAMNSICDSTVYNTETGSTSSIGGYEGITLVLATSGNGETLTDAPRLLSVNTSSTVDTDSGLIVCTGRNGGIQVHEIDVVYVGYGPLLNAVSTSLTINVNPDAINKDTVTSASITGTLTSSETALSDQLITLYIIDDQNSYGAVLGTATTVSDGSYTYDWIIDAGMNVGDYQIRAVYAGVTDYAASSAQTPISISNSVFVVPESALGTFIALLSGFGAFVVYINRSKFPFSLKAI